jgi:hypothetical protein
MTKIAHIINPVKAPKGSELDIVQPITFETMRLAKSFTQAEIEVELFTTCYSEDHSIIPDFFIKTKDLDKSIRDIDAYASKKKLPFIKDILGRLFDATDAQWLIYTNADICLMPQFYMAVNGMIAEGHDAILINRRRISKRYNSIAQLAEMYSDIGGSHPGYDCFVFHRSLLDRFLLDGICIGVPFIEVSLLHNLIAFASNLKHVDDMHLTFHIGMEVMPAVDKDLYQYNRGIYESNIRPQLKPDLDITKFPYAELPFYKRMIKRALNPCYEQIKDQIGRVEMAYFGSLIR